MGAKNSSLFEGLSWGGMSTDTSIFLQSSLNMTEVQARAASEWRIFSKLGAGWSTSRLRGEIVSNAYACLPGGAGSESSLEFTITTRGSVPGDSSLVPVQDLVLTAMQGAVGALTSGKLSI